MAQYSLTLSDLTAPNYGFQSLYGEFVAGQTISQGQVCYLDNSNIAWLACANALATCSGILCICGGGIITPGMGGSFLVLGYYNIGGFNQGNSIYLSDTVPGGLQNYPPTNSSSFVRQVGYASATNVIAFNLGGFSSLVGQSTGVLLTVQGGNSSDLNQSTVTFNGGNSTTV